MVWHTAVRERTRKTRRNDAVSSKTRNTNEILIDHLCLIPGSKIPVNPAMEFE